MSPMLSDIMAEVYSYLWDESTVYETANWMLHHDRWVNNTHSSNFTNFKRVLLLKSIFKVFFIYLTK